MTEDHNVHPRLPAPWPRSKAQLLEDHCFFGVDRVGHDWDATYFKQRARWQQACWREYRGLPIGSHAATAAGPVLNGSRIDLDAATGTGANFLSPDIVEAVRERLDRRQAHQMLDEARLWSDLLSSMPMCFNLLGEAAGDARRLSTAVDVLWPDHPGQADQLIFEWSPGRRDPRYLNNRTAFDAAILLTLGDGTAGVIGIETKYHEHIKRERAPHHQKRLPLYRRVAQDSGVFAPGWEEKIVGTDLQQIWLDHLLVLAMLQHPSGRWTWGRFCLVYPAANPSVRAAADRYRHLLVNDDTFETRTLEELLDRHVLHTDTTEALFRQRYLWPAEGPSHP